MRLHTAALTSVATLAALTAAWKTGSQGVTSATALPGVHVVGSASSGSAASSPAVSPTKRVHTKAHSPATPAATPKVVRRTIDGATVATPYGQVQVAIVVRGTRITDVKALQLTDSGGHSVALSAHAAPILRREALAAQSAHIDSVSGATYTSQGYTTSLQAALDQAHL